MIKLLPFIKRLLTDPLWLCWASALFSASVLEYALYTQYFQGLHPCELCIFQRIPYGVIIVAGLAVLAQYRLAWPALVLITLACAANAGLGFYHVGVEQHWWARAGCGGSLDMSGSVDDLLKQIQNAPTSRCDEVQWRFLTLSMASWNAMLCAIGAAVCGNAVWRSRPKNRL